MKRLLRTAIVALGLTQIYLLAQTGKLLSPSHILLYHWSGTASDLFVPVIFLYCLSWFALTLLLLVPGRLGAVLWAVLIAAVPLQLIQSFSQLSGNDLSLRFSTIAGALTLVAIVTLAAIWVRNPEQFERGRRIAGIVFGFVAIAALYTLSQLLWLTWRTRDLNASLPLHSPSATAPAKPRVIWILFDELSYQQVYGQRYPGLQLPAFDRLAGQASVFTDVIPAGYRTEVVIPSLFTGQRADDIRSSSDGHQLLLHHAVSSTWSSFNPYQTVFQDALEAGYSTAIAGWYNPYCRIMPQVLDRCFWTLNMPLMGALTPSRTIMGNITASFASKAHFLPDLISRFRKVAVFHVESSRPHQLDYQVISSAADRLLEDPSANFIFLHLPIPHPVGIYNRHTGQFADQDSTYIDNLALADRYLAHARAVLEQNGTWDSSTVIVMGDHSWRTWLWKNNWGPEQQRATHGGEFDPRPAYIVKLPYQHQPARIDSPYAAIHTRALLDAIIAGQIHSPAGLAAWTAQWKDGAGDKTNIAAR